MLVVSMRRLFCFSVALALVLCAQPVFSKARLIVVFELRSTANLTAKAQTFAAAIADRVAQVDGFDAKVLPAPGTGTLGAAAAAAGAESYIVGQVSANGTGYHVVLGSFSSATDKSLGDTQFDATDETAVVSAFDAKMLLDAQAKPLDPDAQGQVAVAGGVAVILLLDAPVSSASAKIGDTFSLHAADDIVQSGHIVIAKGAHGEGEVMVAEHSGGNGHPGKLGIQFDWISANDGERIKLSNTPRQSDGEAAKGAASTATIASYVLLGPLGLFAHNFVHGRDITIESTTKLTAYVDHTVRVVPGKKGETPGDSFAK